MMSLKLMDLRQMNAYTTTTPTASCAKYFPKPDRFDKPQPTELLDLPKELDPFEHSNIWAHWFGLQPVSKVTVDDHAV